MILRARGKQRPRGARTKQEPTAGEQQNRPAAPEPRCRSKTIFPRHIMKDKVIVLTDINLNMYCNTKHISLCRKQLWGSEVKLITQTTAGMPVLHHPVLHLGSFASPMAQRPVSAPLWHRGGRSRRRTAPSLRGGCCRQPGRDAAGRKRHQQGNWQHSF